MKTSSSNYSDPVKICPHCRKEYFYNRVDNQINESWYVYCAECGSVGLVTSHTFLPRDVYLKSGYELSTEAEPYLPPCACGGAYRRGASPRCPYCGTELGKNEMLEMLDHYYSKREWSGATSKLGCLQHCIVINDRINDLH